MSTWLPLILPAVTSLAIIIVLGVPSAIALRVRGFGIAIVAIPAAFAILAITSIVASALSVQWTILAPLVFAFALALALSLFNLSKWFGRSPHTLARTQRFWPATGAAAIGGFVIAIVLALGMKRGDAISQTYDAIFHLNAVRQIFDTGDASPFAMDLASPGSPSFYPTLWHGFVALVAQLTGTSIPIATNAVVFTVCALVWPIGAVALGRAIAGPSFRTTLISGVIAAAFPTFPIIFASRGVLYPNLLSYALIPFVLVGVLQLLALGAARRSDPFAPATRWLLFAGGTGAALAAHPNALHVLLLWLAVPAVVTAIRAFRGQPVMNDEGLFRLPRRPRSARAALAIIWIAFYVLMIIAAWIIGRTGNTPWGGKHGPRSALLDAAGLIPHLDGHTWSLTVLVIVGTILAFLRPRYRWIIGVAGVLLIFYVIADGFPPAEWRAFFLSPWYSDPWRLAGLVPFGVLPLAVYGGSAAAAVVRIGILRSSRMLSISPRRFQIGCVCMAVLFLLGATQSTSAQAAISHLKSTYKFNEDSPLLSPTERILLDRLPAQVPEDAVILVNPWNGGALAYAISDRAVFTPHTGGNYDPRITTITRSLDRGTPEACAAVHELDAEYVLDFGRDYVFPDTPRADPFDGISGVRDSSVLVEIDREGSAILYRITC
jgi:hypothetical protein